MRKLFLLLLAFWAIVAGAQNLLPVPELTGRVIDQTGTLDDIQRKGLDDKLAALEKSKGSQVVFLLVPTTQPEDIFSFANRVANTWKIGRKGVGDGVLLVVAKNDRKINIQVAKTLEGAIPDVVAAPPGIGSHHLTHGFAHHLAHGFHVRHLPGARLLASNWLGVRASVEAEKLV